MKDSTFQIIWSEMIYPSFRHYQKKHGGIICPEYCAVEIKAYYENLIDYAKQHYMTDREGLLNRHKVAAALMIAILKAKPIKKVASQYYATNSKGIVSTWAFNEALAVTVGLSVMRAFIEARVDYAFSGKKLSRRVFDGVCQQDKKIFANGIPINPTERSEWEWELYQIRQDGAYSLLSIAHVLCGLEKCARYDYFLNHPEDKPVYPPDSCFSDSEEKILSLDDILGTE